MDPKSSEFFIILILGLMVCVKAQLNRTGTLGIVTTENLVSLYDNYPLQTHSVTTEDGYILELHRIPQGVKFSLIVFRPVVILAHSIFTSSADFVIFSPQRSLAFLLADIGFDVWMVNFRGNVYSTDHTNLDYTENQYWNFSFHEMGKYDLPAAIDYITKETKRLNVHLVGHGMGATAAFIMGSLYTKYNSVVKSFHGLAPLVFLKTNKTAVEGYVKKFQDSDIIKINFDRNVTKEVVGNLRSNTKCQNFKETLNECTEFVQNIQKSTIDLNMQEINTILSSIGPGTSRKQLNHYEQLMNSGAFREYNNGAEYALNKFIIKTSLYFGTKDFLTSVEDVDRLATILPNVENKRILTYAHYDFIYGRRVASDVYNEIVHYLAKAEHIFLPIWPVFSSN